MSLPYNKLPYNIKDGISEGFPFRFFLVVGVHLLWPPIFGLTLSCNDRGCITKIIELKTTLLNGAISVLMKLLNVIWSLRSILMNIRHCLVLSFSRKLLVELDDGSHTEWQMVTIVLYDYMLQTRTSCRKPVTSYENSVQSLIVELWIVPNRYLSRAKIAWRRLNLVACIRIVNTISQYKILSIIGEWPFPKLHRKTKLPYSTIC